MLNFRQVPTATLCPLWVKSGRVQCKLVGPLSAKSGHLTWRRFNAALYRICGQYPNIGSMNEDVSKFLESRLGRLHAKLRLGIEAEHEAQLFGQGINYFHIENLSSSNFVITSFLKLAGLYGRGRRNATQIQVRRNYVRSIQIPKAFDGFAILHLSDLHVDISRDAMERLTTILPEL
ncbi:MAG TPA: hypothetical protein VGQ63_17880, partial [Pseudolabrys sp.]|nr:hypothetical protein [Pseudolabrys sp.]